MVNGGPGNVTLRDVVSIQACRGGKFDYGVESDATDGPASAASMATDDETVKDMQVSMYM